MAETTSKPDAGCLPAWEENDLPEPKPFGLRNWAALIGPGIVVMGGMVGQGEWLLGPKVTAQYGPAVLWIATLAIGLQVFLNTECARYTLYTGEPVFTGYLRCRPGPKFWLAAYAFLDIGSIWPAAAAAAATALAAAWLGRLPDPADKSVVVTCGYLVLTICVLWVLWGGKVYNSMQLLMAAKVFYVLGFLLVVGILWVPLSVWWEVFSGWFRFGTLPTDLQGKPIDWALLAAFAAYAGGGGLSNASIGNYVRDKGWGMGSLVGAIPSAIGGKKYSLSHIGQVFRPTAENLRRWKAWWRYVVADQYGVWLIGCVLSVALPALLSVAFVRPVLMTGEPLGEGGFAAAAIQAEAMSRQIAPVFWPLTLILGFVILFTCQLQGIDHIVRRWTDMIWTGSAMARRRLSGGQVNRIYYAIFIAYALWGCLSLHLMAPMAMVVLAANINVFTMGFTAFHTLYVNRRFLPPECRPSRLKEVGLIACGVFYLALTAVVLSTQVFGVKL